MESIRIAIELKEKYEFSSDNDFAKYFMSLTSALMSATEKKVYDDFLNIFQKYKAIINRNITEEPPCGYYNNALFFRFNLIALLYTYFRHEIGCKENLKIAIQELIYWTDKVQDKVKFEEGNQNSIRLVQSVLEDKIIYYTINFDAPYQLPLENGIYNLSLDGKTIGIEILLVEKEHLVSHNKDKFFSKIKLKIPGFSNCDSYWKGSSIEKFDNESFQLITEILEIMNNLVMKIKIFDENSKIHIINPDDIGQITTRQYYENGEVYDNKIALQSSRLPVFNMQSPQYVKGNIEEFKKNILEIELLLYEELYSISLIDISNENYLSAFMILHSATEAMIEYFLRSYCQITDKIKFYDNLMIGTSMCEDCKLYLEKQYEANYEHHIKAKPTAYMTQLKKVLREVGISSKDINQINNIISKIKQETLRNDLVHGRKRHISRDATIKSLKSFNELEIKLYNIRDMLIQRAGCAQTVSE